MEIASKKLSWTIWSCCLLVLPVSNLYWALKPDADFVPALNNKTSLGPGLLMVCGVCWPATLNINTNFGNFYANKKLGMLPCPSTPSVIQEQISSDINSWCSYEYNSVQKSEWIATTVKIIRNRKRIYFYVQKEVLHVMFNWICRKTVHKECLIILLVC